MRRGPRTAAARARPRRREEGSLRILSVEFAGAIGAPGGPVPGSLPAVAFAGRSNVGKSSLVNRLLGRTRTAIARVSSRPGKTQEINFYHVRARREAGGDAAADDLEFYLVDLPGYGFAQLPAALRGRWKPLIEAYLGDPNLRGVVQLIDARHGATEDDVAMLHYLAQAGVPALIALTKADKLKGNVRRRELAARAEELSFPEEQVIPVSATSGEGCDVLLESMEELLAEERT